MVGRAKSVVDRCGIRVFLAIFPTIFQTEIVHVILRRLKRAKMGLCPAFPVLRLVYITGNQSRITSVSNIGNIGQAL